VTRGAVGTPAYMAPEQARDTQQASMASDMFSLGATLLFAATGHAPYQGETVMDVLVRLATEPPDLTGLPEELTGMVTACLERSPRKRPASAALLAQLGPFVDSPAAANGSHSYLTPAAMKLIEDYRNGPRLADVSADDMSGEATFGSHTALPVPRQRRLRVWLPRSRPGGPGGHPRYQSRNRRRRHRAALGLAGRTVAAAALVAVGAAIGVLVSSGGGGSPDPSGTPTPALPAGLAGPPPGPPPTSFATAPKGRPAIELLQPNGDPDTVFLLHGTGWPPQTRVTVALAGHGTAAFRPAVDAVGTCNYAIGQGHDFFPGPIPVGIYRVVVTGAGGRRAAATFLVNPPPRGSPFPSAAA